MLRRAASPSWNAGQDILRLRGHVPHDVAGVLDRVDDVVDAGASGGVAVDGEGPCLGRSGRTLPAAARVVAPEAHGVHPRWRGVIGWWPCRFVDMATSRHGDEPTRGLGWSERRRIAVVRRRR